MTQHVEHVRRALLVEKRVQGIFLPRDELLQDEIAAGNNAIGVHVRPRGSVRREIGKRLVPVGTAAHRMHAHAAEAAGGLHHERHMRLKLGEVEFPQLISRACAEEEALVHLRQKLAHGNLVLEHGDGVRKAGVVRMRADPLERVLGIGVHALARGKTRGRLGLIDQEQRPSGRKSRALGKSIAKHGVLRRFKPFQQLRRSIRFVKDDHGNPLL